MTAYSKKETPITPNPNETVKELALASIEPKSVEFIDGHDEEVLVLPSGASLANLDQYLTHPRRANSKSEVHTVNGFIDYIKDFKLDQTALFGDPSSSRIFKGVIDFHSREIAGWSNHSISLNLLSTAPWNTWTNSEKKRLGQREFLNFIEDNIGDIVSPDHADIISAIKEFKTNSKGSTKSEVVGGAGQKAEVSAELTTSEFPEIIELALAPWRFVDTYRVKARLFAHIFDGAVEFSYQLTNKDRVLEAVFDDLLTKIEKETELKVYV